MRHAVRKVVTAGETGGENFAVGAVPPRPAGDGDPGGQVHQRGGGYQPAIISPAIGEPAFLAGLGRIDAVEPQALSGQHQRIAADHPRRAFDFADFAGAGRDGEIGQNQCAGHADGAAKGEIRRRGGYLLPRGVFGAGDVDAVLARPVGVSAAQRHRIDHRHAADIGIAAGPLDLADDVERAVVHHLHADPRVLQVIGLELGDDGFLDPAHRKPADLDVADQRHRDGAGAVDQKLPRQVGMAEHVDLDPVARTGAVFQHLAGAGEAADRREKRQHEHRHAVTGAAAAIPAHAATASGAGSLRYDVHNRYERSSGPLNRGIIAPFSFVLVKHKSGVGAVNPHFPTRHRAGHGGLGSAG